MNGSIEARLEELEREVARLRERIANNPPKDWRRSFGVFSNDADYDRAMRLGREWREAQTYEKEIAGS